MPQLLILDRDGVINADSPDYIKHPDEWHPLPGALEAIAALKEAGYQVAVATNQSGIARGLYDVNTLNAIHEKMQTMLQTQYGAVIDYIAYCPHAPKDACDCRKPKPGLLFEIAKYFRCDLSQVPFVGDSARDLEAAGVAGCIGILVKTGKGLETFKKQPDLGAPCYDDLAAFVRDYLRV